ncbi:JmjC domain-containing protein 1 [Hondaea fermentalgiana]|uniref:JmjC domain-containing protein 1 n=1 Tax=Hondaea fermentalgiana TaxID=2315210 RepID=A0A2R5G5H8_9STRA|nr:JmjC domain-containing protein 1 [Hondaea fermentalgiana]|eukprot:GBG25795.1 JmjC domain-containing protein 1 [Hondaea fermentalgiana]
MMKARKHSSSSGSLPYSRAPSPTEDGQTGLLSGRARNAPVMERVMHQVDAVKQSRWFMYVVVLMLVSASFMFGYAAHGKQDVVVAGSGNSRAAPTMTGSGGTTLPAVGNDGFEITSENGNEHFSRRVENGDPSPGDVNPNLAEETAEEEAEREEDERADESAAAEVADLYLEPFHDLTSMKDSDIFENYAEYAASADVVVPDLAPKQNEWWGVQEYARLYRANPIKRFVPVLKRSIQLNEQNFRARFRKFGQPVLFRMDNMRKSGYTGRAFTFEELNEMFPFDGHDVTTETFAQYRPNARFDGEVDLGPGLAALRANATLVKKKGLRNLPRNMKIKPHALQKLGIRPPPLFPRRWMQRGSLWMGNGVSGTASHSDCCDNIVAMIAGTKRFTIAPPSDFQLLKPRCVGRNKGLCYGDPADPNAPGVSSSHYNKMIVDIKPGELLYLPAGWFHHVQNMGSSVMVNYWVHGKDTAAAFMPQPPF